MIENRARGTLSSIRSSIFHDRGSVGGGSWSIGGDLVGVLIGPFSAPDLPVVEVKIHFRRLKPGRTGNHVTSARHS
jgi:hypothetical protein